MSEAYLTLLPAENPNADAAVARVDDATGRLRGIRTELEAVAPAVTELERRLAAATAELERAHEQSRADRETIERLEAEVAQRDAVRASVRDRLADLRRVLETP